MTRQTTVHTHSAEETIVFGRKLAAELNPPQLILLRGDLGAGKTTLVKGIAETGGKAVAIAADVSQAAAVATLIGFVTNLPQFSTCRFYLRL